MAFKFVLVAALVACANAGNILTKVTNTEYDPYPQYNYNYHVADASTGDFKSQSETRNGDNVQGSYSLLEADGTRRVVDYAADAFSGFNAIVRKEPAAVAVAPAPVAIPAPAPVAIPAPAPVAVRAPLPYAAPAPIYGRAFAAPAPLPYAAAAPLPYAAPAPYYARSFAAAPLAGPAFASPYFGSYASTYSSPLITKTFF